MKKIFSILTAISMMLISVQVLANVISVGQIVYPMVTILAGHSTSAAVTTSGMQLVGCLIPAPFTSASISFSAASSLSGSYQEIDNSSGKVSYNVSAGKYISINPADFAGVEFFKIVTNLSEGGTRNLVCSMKGM